MGGAWRVPSVRAFNEGSLRPRVARAQETSDSFLSPLSAALAERVSPHSYRLSREEWPGCPLLRASDEHIPIVRVRRARRAPGRSSPSLLNRRQPPLPFLDSHEGPGFAGFPRYLFAAFDEIARLSVLFRQR